MRPGPDHPRLAWLLAAAAASAAAVFLVSTLVFLHASYWPGPAVDFWHFMRLLEEQEHGARWWPRLVQEHGGHRLLVPRLLYLAEYHWFAGRNVFLLSCSVALQGATAALVVAAVWRERGRVAAPALLCASGVAVALLSSSAQLENFARAWNVHWFLVFAAAAGAFAALAAAARSRGRAGTGVWLALAVAAGLTATWTMANGLLVWPILLLLAAGLRLPLRWSVALTVLAAVGAASFFVGYEPHRNVSPLRLAREPWTQLAWTVRALGMPLSARSAAAGAALGAAALAAGGFAALRLVGRRRAAPAEPLLVGLLLFAAGSLVLAATGRAAQTWGEPRYQTAVLVYWQALLVWALLEAGRRWPSLPQGVLAGQAAVLAWLALVVWPAHLEGARETRSFAARMRLANLAIVVGVKHPPSYAVTLPFADRQRARDRVQRFAKGLERRHQGMFASGRDALLGTSVGAPSPGVRCEGEVREIVPLIDPGTGTRAGTFATGLARRQGARSFPAAILIAGPDGRIVGLGEPPLVPGGAPGTWSAFVRPLASRETLTVWATASDGELCRVASFDPGA